MSLKQLEEYRGLLSEIPYKRAKHIISENERVLSGMKALRAGDLDSFGRYMAESHESLRDLFEVSCAELDLMVDLANREAGVYGARMTGGGFGGSTINLVQAANATEFAQNVGKAYQKETGIVPGIYKCLPAEGAGLVERAEQPG
ncbi:MAG TPA: hypothetical protein VFI75_10565 [Candidatus Acidoferrum sp.]|nr:hypothetical protein [Candidatus Acidoferrum sp.]